MRLGIGVKLTTVFAINFTAGGPTLRRYGGNNLIPRLDTILKTVDLGRFIRNIKCHLPQAINQSSDD